MPRCTPQSEPGKIVYAWRPPQALNPLLRFDQRVSIPAAHPLNTRWCVRCRRRQRIPSLAHTEPLCPALRTETALSRCATIRTQLSADGLFADPSAPVQDSLAQATTSWRISPCPLLISEEQLAFFTSLGPHLLAFYRAMNRLYIESVKGVQPPWIAGYLDQGKPEALVTYSRMERFRDDLPAVIRPDVIPTQDGMVITELDSVPGGIGLTACLSALYLDQGASDGLSL